MVETTVFCLMAEEGSAGAKVGGHQASWTSPVKITAVGPLVAGVGRAEAHEDREVPEGFPFRGWGVMEDL